MSKPRWMRINWCVVERESRFSAILESEKVEGEKPFLEHMTEREAKNRADKANAERAAIRRAKEQAQ